MTPEQVISLVQNIGVGATVALSLIYVAYKLGIAVVDKVLVPVGSAHIDFLKTSTDTMKSVKEDQTKIVDSISVLKGEKQCVYRPVAELLPPR